MSHMRGPQKNSEWIDETIQKGDLWRLQQLKAENRQAITFRCHTILRNILIGLLVFSILLAGGFLVFHDQLSFYLQNQKADQFLQNGKYEEAIAIFAAMENGQEEVKRTYYQWGDALLTQGQYSQARTAFEKANDYQDAPRRVQEVSFLWGKNEIAHRNYSRGQNLLLQAGDYPGVAEALDDSYYSQGLDALTREEYSAARGYFQKIQSPDRYSDLTERMEQCNKWRVNAVLCKEVINGRPANLSDEFEFGDTIYLWCEITSGLPDGILPVRLTAYMPNGEVLVDEGDDYRYKVGDSFYTAYHYNGPSEDFHGYGEIVVSVSGKPNLLQRLAFTVS